MEQKVILQEFLSLSPLGIKKFGSINDIDIYSDDDITEKVKLLCEKNPITNSFSTKISELIDNKKILIGYTKSPMGLIFKKLKNLIPFIDKDPLDSTYGFYSITDDKIVILLENLVNILGMGGQRSRIPNIIKHELIHMAFANNPKEYLLITAKDLIKYYDQVIRNTFIFVNKNIKTNKIDVEMDIDNKLILELIVKLNYLLIKKSESIPMNKLLMKTYLIWKDLFNTLLKNEKLASKLAYHLSTPYLTFLFGSKSSVDNSLAKTAILIFGNSYKTAFDNINVFNITTPFQEYMITSEVHCILGDFYKLEKLENVINKID